MQPVARRGLVLAQALLTIACASIFVSAETMAQGAAASSWTETKCERYRKAWTWALARRGGKGIGVEFRERHEAFLASGCLSKADVCPRSPEEFELANVMTILAMNAGTASTFLPFACR